MMVLIGAKEEAEIIVADDKVLGIRLPESHTSCHTCAVDPGPLRSPTKGCWGKGANDISAIDMGHQAVAAIIERGDDTPCGVVGVFLARRNTT